MGMDCHRGQLSEIGGEKKGLYRRWERGSEGYAARRKARSSSILMEKNCRTLGKGGPQDMKRGRELGRIYGRGTAQRTKSYLGRRPTEGRENPRRLLRQGI